MFEQLLQIVFLGLVQGLTEWLPISSTAHLKLAENLSGFSATPLFNLILHVGTLSAVIFFFRNEVRDILAALVRLNFSSEAGMFIPRIVVGTIPTAVIGITYVLFLGDSLQTVPLIAVTLLVGATIVYSSRFGKEGTGILSYKTVLLIGLAQGFAVFPGLSRSGVTISLALLLGLRREKAFKFSFLLSIPAVIGDFVVEAYNQQGLFSASDVNLVGVFVGFVVAAVGGYFALRLVARIVRSRKFHYFAFYTWTLGILLLILTFFVF